VSICCGARLVVTLWGCRPLHAALIKVF
jgi:hypothetical protein